MFLAKMQLQTAAPRGKGHIMMYDRRMTFVAFLKEDKVCDAYRKFVQETQEPRGEGADVSVGEADRRLESERVCVWIRRQQQT